MSEDEIRSAGRTAELFNRHCAMARDEMVRGHMKIMMASLISPHSDQYKEHRILFLVGESDSGKSQTLKHVMPSFGLTPYADEDGEAQPLLRLKMPTPCTLRNIAVECLRVLGMPVRGDIREGVVWPIFRKQIVARRIVLIVFDEAQRMMRMDNENELQKVSDTLITLVEMEDWPMRMVLCGISILETLRDRDDQMRNRSQIVRFDSVSEKNAGKVGEWLTEIVTDHASLGLGDIPVEDYSMRLIKACEGNVGSIIKMIRSAAGIAITDGRSVIERSDFAKAYHRKTACTPQTNLFEVAKWTTLEGGLAKSRAGSDPVDATTVPAPKMKPGERPR
ncbi:Cdc6-like AAA superfamily ATPase [Peteryoungia aggregata LMG 23059]|uniref:Cdc6-like AAA superfamily ATPase n=1 Tax=Peteryoungia aggregata LMG 23059 TaxID=1368425 RepID=A0ABU0G8A3_9HYPH|nr:ATP-binding protein [Peteryoungia aggregata]MDQ0420910.1 Cdc6-like AAA superfamily ATPase [Peteryoungia aggregata LMG 23059]